jgi:hypothetical protein
MQTVNTATDSTLHERFAMLSLLMFIMRRFALGTRCAIPASRQERTRGSTDLYCAACADVHGVY